MFSHDGETLLTRASATARLWNVRTRRPLAAPFAGAFEDGPVAFSSDDTTLATIVSVRGGPQLLHVWNARDGHMIGAPLASRGGNHLAAEALSKDGVFAAGDEDGTLRLWDTRPRAPLGRALGNQGGWVRGVAFTAGGSTLASAGVDGTARLWDVRAGAGSAGHSPSPATCSPSRRARTGGRSPQRARAACACGTRPPVARSPAWPPAPER
jgi:WD40 repeat protein